MPEIVGMILKMMLVGLYGYAIAILAYRFIWQPFYRKITLWSRRHGAKKDRNQS